FRSALVAAAASRAAQSTAAPSATDSSNDSYWSRSGSIELLHQSSKRACDRHARGIGIRFSQNNCKLLVVVLKLEASDNGFAIGGAQTLQRGLVARHPFTSDRDVERRR